MRNRHTLEGTQLKSNRLHRVTLSVILDDDWVIALTYCTAPTLFPSSVSVLVIAFHLVHDIHFIDFKSGHGEVIFYEAERGICTTLED